MIPTTLILNSIPTLIAGDTANLAAAAAKHVHLITSPFTPGPLTDFTGLTEATFTGSTALNAASGAQQSFRDAASGQLVVQLIEPVGGWHWKCTVAPGSPEVIVGYCVTDVGDTITYGSALLTTPVTIANVLDSVDLAQVRFTVVPSPLS